MVRHRDPRGDGYVVAPRIRIRHITVGGNRILVRRSFHVEQIVILEIDHLTAVRVSEARSQIEAFPREAGREAARKVGISVPQNRFVVDAVAAHVFPDRIAVGQIVERIAGYGRPLQRVAGRELAAVGQINLPVLQRVLVIEFRHDADGLVAVERPNGIAFFGNMRLHGTLRCGENVVQSAQTNHFVTVDRNIRADIPLYLAGQQSGVDLQVETTVADLRIGHVGR